MKVESNWTKTRYSFICEDEKDKKFLDKMNKYIDMLEEENKKLKDKLMLRLAEIYLLSPTSNQMALYKEWNYSKWYDEVKNQMRKEIKEWE